MRKQAASADVRNCTLDEVEGVAAEGVEIRVFVAATDGLFDWRGGRLPSDGLAALGSEELPPSSFPRK